MILSAKDMKAFSYVVLCREIGEVRAMFKFFMEGDGIPRNVKEELWWKDIEKLESEDSAIDILEERLRKELSILRIKAKNIRNEIAFSEQSPQ